MARTPAWPKRIYLHRLLRTFDLPHSLEDDLNPELLHVNESAPTPPCRRPPLPARATAFRHLLWTDPRDLPCSQLRAQEPTRPAGLRAYGSSVRRVPWWGLVSSIAAPLLLIGGWTVAAAVQPTHFDAFMRTISELAARDTPNVG